jgi:putative phosphoesterase
VIGILADSHDNLAALRRAVRLFNDAKCSLVIHAGDFVAPFAAWELRDLACPVKGVFGNCDGEKPGLIKAFQGMGHVVEAPLIFEHDGLMFLVSHMNAPVESYLKTRRKTGGKGVPSTGRRRRGCVPRALSPDQTFDVLVFGHTHKAEVRRERSVVVVNPGEAGGWLHGKSTVALLDNTVISKAGSRLRSIDVEIITI